MQARIRLAVVGAGPVGLALALQAARLLPQASITLFDARGADVDVSRDPRTLALSLGSVQLLERLGAWPAAAAQAIMQVHVSQAAPSWRGAEVHISAAEQAVPMLGAVLSYGALVSALQHSWMSLTASDPARLRSAFGTPVSAINSLPGGVAVQAEELLQFDLAVVAEGGVFADQARKAMAHDYQQTAWVGSVTLEGATPNMAIECFTRQGPLALLPLPCEPGAPKRAGLVWCVNSRDDPVRELNDTQRLAVMASLLPSVAGRVTSLSKLKEFALGLNAERTLSTGRTVRIGNAAQTLHPVAGQGLNLGLRDAYALVAALRFNADIDAVLRGMEWARGPDRWAMIAATDFLARSFTWRLPGLEVARGLALAGLQAATPLKKALAARMMFGMR